MAKTELDTAFANVSAILSLAQWLALESFKGIGAGEHYKVTRGEGDQLMALLVVTDDYAKRVLAEHDEDRRQSEGGAA